MMVLRCCFGDSKRTRKRKKREERERTRESQIETQKTRKGGREFRIG